MAFREIVHLLEGVPLPNEQTMSLSGHRKPFTFVIGRCAPIQFPSSFPVHLLSTLSSILPLKKKGMLPISPVDLPLSPSKNCLSSPFKDCPTEPPRRSVRRVFALFVFRLRSDPPRDLPNLPRTHRASFF